MPAAARRPEPGDGRADRRPALDGVIGGVEGRALVAGEHPVVALGVVARAVVDRPDDRQPVHPPRLLGQQLAEVDAGHARGDRAERAAEPAGSVGLGVPGLHVSRPAAEPEQDDAPPPGRIRRAARRTETQQVGQRQPAQAQHARLEEAPPRHPVAVPGTPAEDPEHHHIPRPLDI